MPPYGRFQRVQAAALNHTCDVLRWRPTLFAYSIYIRGWRDGGTEIRIMPEQCHNPPAGSNVMAGVPVALNFQDVNARARQPVLRLEGIAAEGRNANRYTDSRLQTDACSEVSGGTSFVVATSLESSSSCIGCPT